MKRCPFCEEEIQDAALKCRFCASQQPVPVVPVKANLRLVVLVAIGVVVLMMAISALSARIQTSSLKAGGAANDFDTTVLAHRAACVSDPNRSHILCPDLTDKEREQILALYKRDHPKD